MKQLIVLLYFCVLFSSCVSTKININEYNNFKVSSIDSTFFTNYNYLFITNGGDGNFFVLSNKITNKDTIYNHLSNFRKIFSGDNINIQLVKIDTLKTIKSSVHMQAPRGGRDWITLDSYNGIAWDNDTIKTDVYFSPQIFDLYIRK